MSSSQDPSGGEHLDRVREGLRMSAPPDPEQLAAVFRDQVSLAQLSALGEQLQRDAAGLIDAAAVADEDIPSASIEADVRLADETARAAFMADIVQALKAVLAKHGVSEGPRYRVAFATYPAEEKRDDE